MATVVDSQYAVVRESLYQLGFEQPMPLGSLALVTSLLNDLVKTTANLKRFDEENRQLKKERVAWELSVEPYKCDNSRLLSECNRVHIELIKQREDSQLQLCGLRRQLRTLETDKQCVEEQNINLCAKLDAMSFGVPSKSNGKAGNLKRTEPFHSTVRAKSAYTVPAAKQTTTACKTAVRPGTTSGCLLGKAGKSTACMHCGDCARNGCDGSAAVQRLKNELQSQTEFVDELRKQLETRDREIVRLTQLINGGGRSTAALGQECCYRGVSTLTEDVALLQRQKLQLQSELKTAVAQQHEAKERACQLAEEKNSLERELSELEKVTLSIEAQFNQRLSAKNDECVQLRTRLDETRRRSSASTSANKANANLENDAIQIRASLRHTEEHVKALQSDLDIVQQRNAELVVVNEKLLAKNAKLRNRVKVAQDENAGKRSNIDVRDNATSPKSAGSSTVELIESERDYYQKLYLEMLNRPIVTDENEVRRLQSEIRSRDVQNQELQHQLRRVESSQSTKALVNRVERENRVLQVDVERLREERDEIRERLHALTDENAMQIQQHRIMNELNARLQNENKIISANTTGLQASAEMLRNRLTELEAIVREKDEECARVRASFEQLKILQEQTEKALSNRQSTLSQRDCQLQHVETQLSHRDSGRIQLEADVKNLRDQLSALQSQLDDIERDRDDLNSKLDTKTEQLFAAEADVLRLRTTCSEKETQLDGMRRKIEQTTSESHDKEGSLRRTVGETESLRAQVKQLFTNHENAMADNRRLIGELADCGAEHDATRKRLRTSESEVERLKSQLTQYVHEVQKAETLLARKEIERDEMLDNYKLLTRDAVELEGTNHTLEQQATDTRMRLNGAEVELETLRDELITRRAESDRLDRQVTELSRQLALAGSELEQCEESRQRLYADLEAKSALCDHLDAEKTMVRAELDECAAIRTKLERDNERLRGDVRVMQTGELAAQANVDQMLSTAREDLKLQREVATRQSGELERLRQRIEELQTKVAEERSNAARNETLVQEYSLQIKELRQRLVDKGNGKPSASGSDEKKQQPDYDRNQDLFEIPTVSAHNRRQRKLSEKFTLRPASNQDLVNQLNGGGTASPNNSAGSDATTDTSSQLDHIVKCLSLPVSSLEAAQTIASNRPSDGDGSVEAFYFAPDSPASLARMSTSLKRPSRSSVNGEAIELAQMHDRFMLHEGRSADVLRTPLAVDGIHDRGEKSFSFNRQRSLIDSMFKKSDSHLPEPISSLHSFDVDSIDALNASLNSRDDTQETTANDRSNARKLSKHGHSYHEIRPTKTSTRIRADSTTSNKHSKHRSTPANSSSHKKVNANSDLSMSDVDVDILARAIVGKVRMEKKLRIPKSPPSKSISARSLEDSQRSSIKTRTPVRTSPRAERNQRSARRTTRLAEIETTVEIEACMTRMQKVPPGSSTTMESYRTAVRSLPSSPRCLETDVDVTVSTMNSAGAPDTLALHPLDGVEPQTFDTSLMPPPPPFDRKRVCCPIANRINTINLHVMTSNQATGDRVAACANAKLSANCVVRRM